MTHATGSTDASHHAVTQNPVAQRPAQPAEQHTLQCLEIWGGNTHVDSRVSVTGLDAWVWSQPTSGVAGGDIYLVSMCACARVSRFVLADVTGHSERAAALALRLRRLMRRHINTPDQTDLARALNDDFSDLTREGMFATALLATYSPPSQHLIFCNAGHPRPLLYYADVQQWEFVHPGARPLNAAALNLPLGVIRNTEYMQSAVQLKRGDLVLAFTDGLTESRDEQGRMLGGSGLLELVRRCDPARPETLLACLRDQLARHARVRPFNDDTSLLLLRASGGRTCCSA